MADIDLSSEVNWSTCKGGGPPASGDTVFLNNGAIFHLDGSDASTYTAVAIKAATSGAPTTYNQNGYIVLDNATSTIDALLNAGTVALIPISGGKNVVLPKAATAGSAANAAPVNMTTGTNTLTAAALIGGTHASAYAGIVNGTGNTFALTSVSSPESGGPGLYCASCNASTPSTIGTATGGANYGARIDGGLVSITTAQGGSASASGVGVTTVSGSPVISIASSIGGGIARAFGSLCNAGTITIASAKGGSVPGACGAMVSGGTLVINGTDLGGQAPPVGYYYGTLKVADGVQLAFGDADGAMKRFYPPELLPDKGDVVEGALYGDSTDSANYGTTEGTAEGTYHEATVAEVEDGVMFGPDSSYEGEYAGGGGGGVRRGGALRGA